MALPQTYGIDHEFGPLDVTQSFITVQSDNLKETCALSVEVKDEQGRVITVRKDDLRQNINFVGILKQGAGIPEAGSQHTYDGIIYIIDDVSNDGTNDSFRRVGLNCTKYQEIA